ncbi:hypothetical protein JI752_006820 [Lysobacter sp. MMG2]|uniref:hypothetical protein n=1 Tax=Lysobacter sp. MMG2 TaxID=2801338 RepID=UPI001C220087|nr:hypothetical protein [Lysobacter sp. MMG2]MBU8975852.1 hypothetical protein [Lysobacter sp. MMG2]
MDALACRKIWAHLPSQFSFDWMWHGLFLAVDEQEAQQIDAGPYLALSTSRFGAAGQGQRVQPGCPREE